MGDWFKIQTEKSIEHDAPSQWSAAIIHRGVFTFCRSLAFHASLIRELEGVLEFTGCPGSIGPCRCGCLGDGCSAPTVDRRRWPRALAFGCCRGHDARPDFPVRTTT